MELSEDRSVGRRCGLFEAALRAGYSNPDFRRMVFALLIIYQQPTTDTFRIKRQ
jgi:hypothetical protein